MPHHDEQHRPATDSAGPSDLCAPTPAPASPAPATPASQPPRSLPQRPAGDGAPRPSASPAQRLQRLYPLALVAVALVAVGAYTMTRAFHVEKHEGIRLGQLATDYRAHAYRLGQETLALRLQPSDPGYDRVGGTITELRLSFRELRDRAGPLGQAHHHSPGEHAHLHAHGSHHAASDHTTPLDLEHLQHEHERLIEASLAALGAIAHDRDAADLAVATMLAAIDEIDQSLREAAAVADRHSSQHLHLLDVGEIVALATILLALLAVAALILQPAVRDLRAQQRRQDELLRESREREREADSLARRSKRLADLQVIVGDTARAFLSSEDLNETIDYILSNVGRHLDVSRAYLFRYRGERRLLSNTHEWCAPGVEPAIDTLRDLDARDFEPWTALLSAKEPLTIEDVDAASDLDDRSRAFLEEQGIRALLCLPVFINGELEGFVGFDECRGPRRWADEEIALLRTVVESFSRAVERRVAARALERSEERLDLAVQVASLGAWDWDVDTNHVDWNDYWFELLSMDPAATVQRIGTWETLIHPDDRPATLALLQAHLDGETPLYEAHYRVVTPDGRTLHLSDRGRVVTRHADGRAKRLVGLIRDETAAVKAQETLAASELRLRRFVESMPAAVAMFDADMRYLTVSKGWLEELGLDADIVGRTHYDVFPDIPERWRAIHRRCLAGEVLRTDRDRFDRDDGSTLWLEWEIHPWFTEAGEIGGIIMFTDLINDQVENEQALERARCDAESASQAKSDFLAAMSHELRSPLAAVLGYTELLARKDPPKAERAELLDKVRLNGELLLNLINDTLDLSKIEAGKLRLNHRPAPLDLIVHQSLAAMKPRADEKGLALLASARTPVPARVVTDDVRLRQILINLLSNAVKFSDSGEVRVELAARDDSLIVSVLDHGRGVPAEFLERLFKPFEQLDVPTRRIEFGSGLGLAICQRLASALGGMITCASSTAADSHGSIFTLNMPLQPAGDETIQPGPLPPTNFAPAGAALDDPNQDALHKPLRGRRVLLVEDGRANAEIISYYLSSAGALVTHLPDGRAALDHLLPRDPSHADGAAPRTGDHASGASNGDAPASGSAGGAARPTVDAVVMDMQMPIMDGFEATRAVRAAGLDVPIVAVTAYVTPQDREACLAAGADAFLPKPVDPDALVALCARLAFNTPSTPVASETEPHTPTADGERERTPERMSLTNQRDERLRTLVESYLRSLPAIAGDLQNAIANHDRDSIEKLAHRLAGTAGNYGLPALSELARRTSTLARERASDSELRDAARNLVDALLDPPTPTLPKVAS